jgi:hypothetical protein
MVDIVIVNWNSGDLLRKCLQSVFTENSRSFIGKVIVIDNNSADGSMQGLPENQALVVIKNTTNNGFAKAVNQGFHLSNSNYVLLLNPDAMLLENTLGDCHSFMDENIDIDILGCQLLDENGAITTSCARFMTPATIFHDASGLSKIAPNRFHPATLMTDWDHKHNRVVDQVMGAFMFIRSAVFKKIGYFDERFFVYCEELDFSLRLVKHGGKSFFNADIKAIHIGEGTTSKVKAFRLFLLIRSRLLYAKKHFSTAGYYAACFSSYCIEPFSRSFFLLVQGRIKEIGSLVKTYWLLINNKK